MQANKTLYAAIGVLLIAGIAAVVLFKQNPGKDAEPGANGPGGGSATAGGNAGGDLANASGSQSSAAARARARQTSANADLIAKYGEARTSLSKHVSSNITGIMEDAVQMGEMMASAQGGAFGGGLGMALGRLNNDLQLTEEQKAKAAAIYKEHQQRRTANFREGLERLKQDPTSLMQLMLASDASARGEMTDDEYKQLQAEAGKNLNGVINPLDRKNMGGGSPLRDPDFVNGLKGILDPTQSEKLDAEMAKRQTEAGADPAAVPGVEEGNIASLPKMELEKLDKSIESARKVTTGIKSMMDGMGGLRDMMPPQGQDGQ